MIQDHFSNRASNITMEKRAIMQVTTELLHDLFRLPEGVEIIGVSQTMEDRERGVASIVLKGDGLPSMCERIPGEEPIRVTPKYKSSGPAFDGFQ